jgi:hypothetical protein
LASGKTEFGDGAIATSAVAANARSTSVVAPGRPAVDRGTGVPALDPRLCGDDFDDPGLVDAREGRPGWQTQAPIEDSGAVPGAHER